jgi:hypothetical protein
MSSRLPRARAADIIKSNQGVVAGIPSCALRKLQLARSRRSLVPSDLTPDTLLPNFNSATTRSQTSRGSQCVSTSPFAKVAMSKEFASMAALAMGGGELSATLPRELFAPIAGSSNKTADTATLDAVGPNITLPLKTRCKSARERSCPNGRGAEFPAIPRPLEAVQNLHSGLGPDAQPPSQRLRKNREDSWCRTNTLPEPGEGNAGAGCKI